MADVIATTSSVGRIVVAVLIGAAAGRVLPHKSATLGDFNQMLSKVLIPCLNAVGMVRGFRFEKFTNTLIVPVFSLVSLVVGFLFAKATNALLFPMDDNLEGTDKVECDRDRKLTVLSLFIHNTVIIPLSIAMTLKGSPALPWFDEAAFAEVSAMIFVYSVLVTSVLWGMGPLLLQPDEVRKNASCGTVVKNTLLACWNAPFVGIMLGMVIGMNDSLRRFLQEDLADLYNAMEILSSAFVPCALVTLGASLIEIPISVGGDGRARSSWYLRIWKAAIEPFRLNGMSLKLVIVVPFVRLIVLPATFIALLHFVARGLFGMISVNSSESRPVLLALLLEFISPTAFVVVSICYRENFHPEACSKQMLYQHSFFVVSCILWLNFVFWYLQ